MLGGTVNVTHPSDQLGLQQSRPRGRGWQSNNHEIFLVVANTHRIHGGVSKNRGKTRKMDGLQWKILLKLMIWGYHYFWIHPWDGNIYQAISHCSCGHFFTFHVGNYTIDRSYGILKQLSWFSLDLQILS